MSARRRNKVHRAEPVFTSSQSCSRAANAIFPQLLIQNIRKHCFLAKQNFSCSIYGNVIGTSLQEWGPFLQLYRPPAQVVLKYSISKTQPGSLLVV